MQPCDELKNLIIQLYASEASGRLFDFARQLYSSQEGVVVIGSDPNDKYDDHQAIIRFYQATSAAGLEIEVSEIKAYCENEVGWVIDQVIAKLPNGVEVPVRHTYVFHKEGYTWKIVHAHISVGIPDDEIGK
jgi:hypothetical protein